MHAYAFATFLILDIVVPYSKGWTFTSESRIPFTLYKLRHGEFTDMNTLDNFYRKLSSVSGNRYPFLQFSCDGNKREKLYSEQVNFKPVVEVLESLSSSSHVNSLLEVYKANNVTSESISMTTYLKDATVLMSARVEDFMTSQEVEKYAFILMRDHISKSPNKTQYIFSDFLDPIRTDIVQNMEFTGMILIPTSLLQSKQNESLPYWDYISGKQENEEDTKISPKDFPRYFTETVSEQSNILSGSRYNILDQYLYRTTLDTSQHNNNEQHKETIFIRKIRFSKTLSEYFIWNVVELKLPPNLCHNIKNVSQLMTTEEKAAEIADVEIGLLEGTDIAPSWFSEGVFFCFKWYHDKYIWQCDVGGLNSVLCMAGKIALKYSEEFMASQCGENLISPLCVPVGQMTDPYRDDTDIKVGGCRMSWGIMSRKPSPLWFNQVELCFQWYPDPFGDSGQCGGGIDKVVCAKVGTYTPYYFDNTGESTGGCNMRWKLSVPTESPVWLLRLKLCFHYEADDRDKEQCNNGSDKTSFCVGVNIWTPYYRDNTNLGKGGCRLKWGLML